MAVTLTRASSSVAISVAAEAGWLAGGGGLTAFATFTLRAKYPKARIRILIPR
jgi:hypothetical protein